MMGAMTSRTTYALGLVAMAATLTACGSSSAGNGPSVDGPSTADGLPSIQTTPFPTPSADPNTSKVAQCRADVTEVTNATELFNRQRGYYAPDMKTLVSAGLLKAVPTDVHYGYDAPDVDPVVLGTVAGC